MLDLVIRALRQIVAYTIAKVRAKGPAGSDLSPKWEPNTSKRSSRAVESVVTTARKLCEIVCINLCNLRRHEHGF